MIRSEAAELTDEVLRKAFSCFPSGVTALCALIGGEPVGMAASSFTSVSTEPPTVLVCVSRISATWELLRTADRLGVSILSADHDATCRQLAGRQADRFVGVGWQATPEGAVLVHGASLWLECTVDRQVPAGDHDVVLLRIHALESDPDIAPLVFHRSSFRQLVAVV